MERVVWVSCCLPATRLEWRQLFIDKHIFSVSGAANVRHSFLFHGCTRASKGRVFTPLLIQLPSALRYTCTASVRRHSSSWQVLQIVTIWWRFHWAFCSNLRLTYSAASWSGAGVFMTNDNVGKEIWLPAKKCHKPSPRQPVAFDLITEKFCLTRIYKWR